ncbi:hypothetical protein COO60DRAFT_1457872 [Scenedesmus sp. NREL 46B-D3]|nr:hypothetical protein COO60DRAFT_1457872 [Scenedesmus sp. NREL 46B-D3]
MMRPLQEGLSACADNVKSIDAELDQATHGPQKDAQVMPHHHANVYAAIGGALLTSLSLAPTPPPPELLLQGVATSISAYMDAQAPLAGKKSLTGMLDHLHRRVHEYERVVWDTMPLAEMLAKLTDLFDRDPIISSKRVDAMWTASSQQEDAFHPAHGVNHKEALAQLDARQRRLVGSAAGRVSVLGSVFQWLGAVYLGAGRRVSWGWSQCISVLGAAY